MDKLKKTGIVAGAIVGGIIGGTLSVIGKVSKVKIVDDIGESVVDSAILTGTMAGKVASGAGDLVAGAVKNDSDQIQEGADDLKDTGMQVVRNFTGNVRLVAGSGKEIAGGIRHRNPKRLKKGVRNLIKLVTVGTLTVDAIKVKKDEDETDEKTSSENANQF